MRKNYWWCYGERKRREKGEGGVAWWWPTSFPKLGPHLVNTFPALGKTGTMERGRGERKEKVAWWWTTVPGRLRPAVPWPAKRMTTATANETGVYGGVWFCEENERGPDGGWFTVYAHRTWWPEVCSDSTFLFYSFIQFSSPLILLWVILISLFLFL